MKTTQRHGTSSATTRFYRAIGSLVSGLRQTQGSGAVDVQQTDTAKLKLDVKKKFCAEFNSSVFSVGLRRNVLEVDERTGQLALPEHLAGKLEYNESLLTDQKSSDTQLKEQLKSLRNQIAAINKAIDDAIDDPSQASAIETKVLIVSLTVGAMLILSSICAICATYAAVSSGLATTAGMAVSGGFAGGSALSLATALSILVVADKDEVPIPKDLKLKLTKAEEDLNAAAADLDLTLVKLARNQQQR